MKVILFLSSLLFLFCCKNNNKTENISNVAVKNTIEKHNLIDTTILYNIEGISSEGSEAKVIYKKNKIVKSEISIYGETGQIQIEYSFNNDTINVIEKQFGYKNGGINTNQLNELILKKQLEYKMNTVGKLISNTSIERTDIFKEFTKSVPMQLK
jgi:hypothetical protein